MVVAGTNTNEAVLVQHVGALVSRNLDSLMGDFTDDAVLFSPSGAFKGPENIRKFFIGALELLTPEALGNLKVIKQEIDGEYAYVLWSASPVISFAGDLFHIRGGKIVMQSAVFQVDS